MISKIEQWCLL